MSSNLNLTSTLTNHMILTKINVCIMYWHGLHYVAHVARAQTNCYLSYYGGLQHAYIGFHYTEVVKQYDLLFKMCEILYHSSLITSLNLFVLLSKRSPRQYYGKV